MSGARIDHRLAQRGGCAEALWVPAMLYGAAAATNGFLYRRGLRQVLRVAAPVVSVGNLSAGGTGKTPTVAWLARWFQGEGLRPGIVSRGYGAAAQGSEHNDEARMLARELPGVLHEQDPDRVAAAQRLVEAGTDVVLMDDGFQHRRLDRDLDLVLVDSLRPWGLPAPERGGQPVRSPLPRGLLREPVSALSRADLLMITRADRLEPGELAALERQLERFAPGVPRLLARHAPVALVSSDSGLDLGLERLAGLEVDLLSGVGNPEAVEATLLKLGARVQRHLARPDHHAWSAADLQGLGQRPLVTTAKDLPKLEAHAAQLDLELWTLEIRLLIERGEELLVTSLRSLPPAQAATERAAFHEGLHG